MFRQYLQRLFITTALALIISIAVYSVTSRIILLSMISGIASFLIVYSVYYYYCLNHIDRDSPARFIQRVNIGFVVKVILTVSCFVFIKRHFQLNLPVSFMFFVFLIVLNDVINALTDLKNAKNGK